MYTCTGGSTSGDELKEKGESNTCNMSMTHKEDAKNKKASKNRKAVKKGKGKRESEKGK